MDLPSKQDFNDWALGSAGGTPVNRSDSGLAGFQGDAGG